jgi:peroxiredoxin
VLGTYASGMADLDYRDRGPALGTHFPDLKLPDQNGESVDLHARRAGRRALVVLFRSAVW